VITNKIIENKFYLYKTKPYKVKKILRASNSVILKSILDNSEEAIPYNGGELLLKRFYTIGELAKITGKRTDTLRKYEKIGILPKPSFFIEDAKNSYKNWRFYTEDEVYDAVSFFSGRVPGRPTKKSSSDIKNAIVAIREKVNNL
jgi:hypothetical protein